MEKKRGPVLFTQKHGTRYMSERCSCRFLEHFFRLIDGCEDRAAAEPSHPPPSCRASELVPLLHTCKVASRPALMPWCTRRDTSFAFPLPFLPLLTPGYNLLTYVQNASIMEQSSIL